MPKTKEGRGRMSRLDMSSEAGRLLFHDLRNPAQSKFSPFLESDHQSHRFWMSRSEFQEIPFGAFRQQASQMAKIAIAQMTQNAKDEEEKRIATEKSRNVTAKKETNAINTGITKTTSIAKPQHDQNTQFQSLRDTIVAPHPNGEMAIVIFEIDGDSDESACQLQFAMEGQRIKVFSRIPKELTSAVSLLGKVDSRSSIQDADCMLLDLVIRKRLEGSQQDSNGDYWEIREVIELPFPCKESFFNKHRKEIPSYLLRKNEHGYAWGYFWVVGSHIGRKNEGPRTIRCQTTSDSESDIEQDENRSQLFSSDEDYDNDCDSMEVEFVSNHVANTSKPVAELRKVAEIVELKKCLETKTKEAKTYKEAADADRIKLKELSENEYKRNHAFETERKEKLELSRKISQLEQELNKNKNIFQKVSDLQTKCDLIESENNKYHAERVDLLRQIRQFEEEKKRLLQEKSVLATDLQAKNDLIGHQTQQYHTENDNLLHQIRQFEEERQRLLQENSVLATDVQAKNNLMDHENEKYDNLLHQIRQFEEERQRLLQENSVLATDLQAKNDLIGHQTQQYHTENDNLLHQIRKFEEERQRLLEKNGALCIEITALKDEVKNVKMELETKEKCHQNFLESGRQNVRRLEAQIENLIKENRVALEAKEQQIEELLASTLGKDREYASSQHILREELATMTKEFSLLAENNKASMEREQKAYELLQEKEQQNIYHLDQIEILKRRMVEIENLSIEKDFLENNQAKEICGLKKHLSEQAKYIRQLERQTEKLQKSKQKVRLTPRFSTEEERNVEFGDLCRWNSERSMESVTTNGATHSNADEQYSSREVPLTTNERSENGEEEKKKDIYEGTTEVDLSPKSNEEYSSERLEKEIYEGTTEVDLPPKSNEEYTSESEGLTGKDCRDSTDVTNAPPQSEESSNIELVKPANHESEVNDETRSESKEEMKDESADGLSKCEYHESDVDGKEREETNENHDMIFAINLDESKNSNVEAEAGQPTVLAGSQTIDNLEEQKKKSKKRKSGTDLQDQHPLKRVRKSRRLEEKRERKKLKPKAD